MKKLQPARGTRDIYGSEANRMQKVVDSFRTLGAGFGFEDLATPIFEFTEVFSRPLGESSDIVSKEMYGFEDRGGEALTLRPEFTAGVSRAFVSGGMQQNLPCRFMSHGPLFRYERPQKGRYRQFHQINAELIGPADPLADVEVLTLGWRLLEALGVSGDVTLVLNSLGDPESRANYRDALVAYYEDHRSALSEDSLTRLATNPLRILDSKDDGDKTVNEGAPSIADHLSDAARAFFDRVQAGLAATGIPYTLNPHLVRGLDYYTHTAFEFITDALGAQGTVIGGGRYDGLIKQLGGPDTPAIGFAGGIERLAMLLAEEPAVQAPIFMMPMGDSQALTALSLADSLRLDGFKVIADRSGNLGKRLKRADAAAARFAIILGETECATNMATVKDLTASDQHNIAFDALGAWLREQDA